MADQAARAARVLLAVAVLTGAVYLVTYRGEPPAPAPTQVQTQAPQTPAPLATRPPTVITSSPRPTTPFVLGKRVAFLGDSYTAGFGATPRTRGYAYLTSKRLHLVSHYYGQGGTGYLDDGKTVDEQNTPFAERLRPVIADRPDVIVVQGGINDAGQDLQALQTAAVEVLTQLRDGVPTARLVVIGPFYPTLPPPALILATRDVIADVARYVGATFLDPLAGNWLDPKLIGPDGIHPTNAGHAAIAARLAAELLKL